MTKSFPKNSSVPKSPSSSALVILSYIFGVIFFVDLNDYKFSVIANTNYESMDLKSKDILANSEISASYSGHMDDDYKCNYSLVI